MSRPATPGTRAHLLSTGLRRLHASGYAACGVQEITQAAGVPKGSFYNHFPSKEAFAAAAVDAYWAKLRGRLADSLSDPARPPLERLRGFFEGQFARMEAGGFAGGCFLGNMGLEVADHAPLVRERLAAALADWTEIVSTVLAEARAAGEIPAETDCPATAGVLLAAFEGALMRSRILRDRKPLDDFLALSFDPLRRPIDPSQA